MSDEQDYSFRIAWHAGNYYVSVPNYKGGTVYTEQYVEKLREQLETAQKAWTQAIEQADRLQEQIVKVRNSAFEEAVTILRRRAAGYEARATSIFNGRIMADELKGNAREIEALADRALTDEQRKPME